jgi:hypothetical protein
MPSPTTPIARPASVLGSGEATMAVKFTESPPPRPEFVTARSAFQAEALVISLIAIRIRVEDEPWGN